jgi:purine-cytosine permease-like protein
MEGGALAVSICVRSSIKFLHFVPFHKQIWPPRAILVSDWLLFKKIFSSETAWKKPSLVPFGQVVSEEKI